MLIFFCSFCTTKYNFCCNINKSLNLEIIVNDGQRQCAQIVLLLYKEMQLECFDFVLLDNFISAELILQRSLMTQMHQSDPNKISCIFVSTIGQSKRHLLFHQNYTDMQCFLPSLLPFSNKKRAKTRDRDLSRMTAHCKCVSVESSRECLSGA